MDGNAHSPDDRMSVSMATDAERIADQQLDDGDDAQNGTANGDDTSHQQLPPPSKNSHLLPLLLRASPLAPLDFQPSVENLDVLTDSTRILVVGAGGLGCEILKNLACSGFTDIHVIDMDTIDVSNLNRQFLFRTADVGKYKSTVAADAVMQRCTNVTIKAHTKAIQDYPQKWYTQYDMVIAGLDNIEARRWLNEVLCDLVKFDAATDEVDIDSVIPLIDGGTEAFNGQCRLFLPHVTSCFECSLASLTPATGYPMCTIRNVPRLPEHCIQYALKVLWPKLTAFTSAEVYTMKQDTTNDADNDDDEAVELGSVPLDKDDIHHMTWLYNRSTERAKQFNISGVTFNLTMQVVKNIIPAIASTNAIIAAACCNEAWKYRTQASLTLNNYYMYLGSSDTQGIHTETMKYHRNPDCPVCHHPLTVALNPSTTTLQQLIDQITTQGKVTQPSISFSGKTLYMPNLHSLYADNLQKPLAELGIERGSRLASVDQSGKTLKVIVR